MLRIQQIKLPPDHKEEDLKNAVRKLLRLPKGQPFSYEIIRQSIDARKKPELFLVYTVDVCCEGEKKLLKATRNRNISRVEKKKYHFPEIKGSLPLTQRPVIVGMGPAGLFCALMLARSGFRPILLERGEPVEARLCQVEHFWRTGTLNPESNVQFGEGGAGTFSDGKLNTMVKDPNGKIRFVLETFVKAGADPEILYSYKPHIGTDRLIHVVARLREEILSLGGTVYFNTRLADILPQKDGTYELNAIKEEQPFTLKTSLLVLAIGHSARDTFEMLKERGFAMEPKAFAVGVRVEHPQKMINASMYGTQCTYQMPPSPYKLTHRLENGRGVYSFCMCPGGYVVNASSQEGMLAVNGMSYQDRGSKNANSAIVVTVTPEDFGDGDVLAGIRYQQKLEKRAFQAGQGRIPVQRFADFKAGIPSLSLGSIAPQMKGAYIPANVRQIFPEEIASSIEQGITAFDKKIHGFANPDTLISGVESRTSSPVRILRDERLVSNFFGIYPCGEGAGYAGGITSAALDGIRVAEAIASKFSIDFLQK